MNGSDHSRHALAHRGSEIGGLGPQGRLKVCPIQLAAARAAAVDADAVGLLDARDALQLAPAQARRRPHALEQGYHSPWVRIAAPRAFVKSAEQDRLFIG